MRRLRPCTVFVFAALQACGPSTAREVQPKSQPQPSVQAPTSQGDEAVVRLLEQVRQKHDLPGMAGAIVTSEGVTAMGVTGLRKKGRDARVTLQDRWHLGSDAKAMTAVLVARLVEPPEPEEDREAMLAEATEEAEALGAERAPSVVEVLAPSEPQTSISDV